MVEVRRVHLRTFRVSEASKPIHRQSSTYLDVLGRPRREVPPKGLHSGTDNCENARVSQKLSQDKEGRLTILPLRSVERFRRVGVDHERREVVNQGLVPARIPRAEDVCRSTSPAQNVFRAKHHRRHSHSAHISQATWVSGVIPSKMEGRRGASQSQTRFCCCRGQCLLPRTMPRRRRQFVDPESRRRK